MRVQINFQVASNPPINFCSTTNAQLFFTVRKTAKRKNTKNEKKRNTEYSPISLQLTKGLSTITVTVPLVLPRAPPITVTVPLVLPTGQRDSSGLMKKAKKFFFRVNTHPRSQFT
jgi:hypothetical protein